MIVIAIGICRTKVMAVILGPAGLGLLGLYGSIADVAVSIAGMGIANSGVRQIAEAVASGASAQIARTMVVLRRTSVALAVMGAIALALAAKPLSVVSFGNTDHGAALSLLALAVLCRVISVAQGALIQGMRRVGEFAWMGVLGAALGTMVSIVLVYTMGIEGIVPAIEGNAAMGLVASWWFSHVAGKAARHRPDGASIQGLQHRRMGHEAGNTVVAIDERVNPREPVMGLVGESGCGKTVTGLSILRLVPMPPGRIAGGSIELNGRDLVPLPEGEIQDIRGREVSMIFQEPMTALNPVFTVGSQMADVLCRHRDLTRRQARDVATGLLAKVNIPEPASRLGDYPHQLSGGMRQRVMIAMALSCNPQLLIADEPTTALDVTTQAQVLQQIKALQAEFRMAVILVTHDLGVVAETCRRAMVMYCGSIVEAGDVAELFSRPRHPYTAGLLASIPRLRTERLVELPVIPGRVPDLLNLPAGCRFADRCPRVQERCRVERPPLAAADAGSSLVACHYPL